MPLLGIIASQNYPRTISVDYLVVAGGGGGGSGGNGAAGGGGAGGFRTSIGGSAINVSAGQTLTVTVGAGGAGGTTGGQGR